MRSIAVRITGLLLAFLAGTAVAAEEGRHVFWEVAGAKNTIYLLGSVHVLHESDTSLPEVTEAAYQDAEVLVEELDLIAATGELLSEAAIALQFLPQGQTLPSVLGPELHGRTRAVVRELNFDPDFLVSMQPWFVATMISQLRIAKAGYSAENGVDFQLAQRARSDGKPIVGLETAIEQLAVLASMTLEEQRRFLAATLEESEGAEELREITAAWRRGDLAALEELLHLGVQEMSGFFHRLVVERNLNWLPKIEQMLADPEKDYLVVTGALHMVGEQGLVELLRGKGYKVTRR